jgi:hypothetical protein
MAKTQAIQKTQTAELAKPLEDWQIELQNKAKDRRAQLAIGVPRITHRGGALRRDGELIKELDVIVVDSVLHNAWYSEKWEDGVAATPACYSFGETLVELKPHAESSKKQNVDCISCPKNVFGSGPGRAKECKNQARLLLISPPKDPASTAKSERRQIDVPPTSLKNWSNYCSSLVGTTPTGDPAEVLTRITIGPREKGTGYALYFTQIGTVPTEGVRAAIEVRKATAGVLTLPYPKLEQPEEEAPKTPAKKRKF